ncbi:MAG: ribosomal RNA small subunit methyltransferase G [Micavibrio sp.]|nr:MAG: ribosomal RNA small subunit methyltransferase G [Micavibrio sp.]
MPPKQNQDGENSGDVSRETREKLEAYHALLLKWQKAINLVSASSVGDAWERHFNDSIQLESHIAESTGILADFGSGAGFPGLVLAMLRPALDVHLVESDARKCEFLRTVSRETNTPVSIHNTRIEDMDGQIKPDMITARALANLEKLCGYCLPFAQENPALELLFMKGEKADVEIEEARQKFAFDIDQFPSQTGAAGSLLRLRNLRIL